MLKTPQFVFFDVGNVILGFSHERSRDQIADVCGIDPKLVQCLVFDDGLQNRYESGEIDCRSFADEILEHSKASVSQREVILAASDIFTLNHDIVPLLAALRLIDVPLGILSNTCPGHWEQVLLAAPFVSQYFSRFVLSHESQCMKPGLKIYQDAIALADRPADSIFFVDDRLENVQAARSVGMDAHLFESASQVYRLLNSRGLQLDF